jgi:hypothetical protein
MHAGLEENIKFNNPNNLGSQRTHHQQWMWDDVGMGQVTGVTYDLLPLVETSIHHCKGGLMRSAMLWAASIANDSMTVRLRTVGSCEEYMVIFKYNLIYKNMENILT